MCLHVIMYLKLLLSILAVLGQDNNVMGSRTSASWFNSELTPDEDSSGLDYMLALSLQSDGELLPGNDDAQWSRMWDYNARLSNIPSFTPLSPPNNNYNFTTGTNALVEDLNQTGKSSSSFTENPPNYHFVLYEMYIFSFTETMLPCEFCEELFPEDDLILHQVRKENLTLSKHVAICVHFCC